LEKTEVEVGAYLVAGAEAFEPLLGGQRARFNGNPQLLASRGICRG
jgi:hypothetical protein